jgi:hypothetical protein
MKKDDDEPFLPSKYLMNNLKSREYMVEDEDEEDEWEDDISIIYNHENINDPNLPIINNNNVNQQ